MPHLERCGASRSPPTRKPNSANRLRNVLRAMMKHAIEIGVRSDDPTRDVKAVRIKTDGNHSWTEAEIARNLRRGTPIRSCSTRGSGAQTWCAWGRQHICDGALHVRQQKAGAELVKQRKSIEQSRGGNENRSPGRCIPTKQNHGL